MEAWNRVKIVMEYFEMNKNSFSKEVGLSSNVTIGRILNEKRKPSTTTLKKITNRFKTVSLEWLKTGKGEMIQENPNPSEIFLLKDGMSISILEISDFVINNEEEFLKIQGFKNMVELKVTKKLLELVNDPEKFKKFLKN